jgi:GNAT superfamily N-acetyltransferase
MDDAIVTLSADDRDEVLAVINAAAERYRGVIPAESDTDPYMSAAELESALAAMQFYGAVRDRLVGVIGTQERADVSLVRHLYVRPPAQGEGIGTALLERALERADAETVLVGTWKAAEWAVEFYRANGFELLGTDRDLLATYWDVPEHQRDHSVVLRYVDEG